MSKRQFPKRSVVSVEKTGVYPNVWWEHRLSCGHLERRKRKAPAVKVACSQCGAAEGSSAPDDEATLMQFEAQRRAGWADEFKVPLEQVSVDAYMDGGYPKVSRLVVNFPR